MAWAIIDWAVPTLLVLAPSILEALVRVILSAIADVVERPALTSSPWRSFNTLLKEEYRNILGQSFAGFFRCFDTLLAKL